MTQPMMWNTHFHVQPRIRNSEKEAYELLPRYLYLEDQFSTLLRSPHPCHTMPLSHIIEPGI